MAEKMKPISIAAKVRALSTTSKENQPIEPAPETLSKYFTASRNSESSSIQTIGEVRLRKSQVKRMITSEVVSRKKKFKTDVNFNSGVETSANAELEVDENFIQNLENKFDEKMCKKSLLDNLPKKKLAPKRKNTFNDESMKLIHDFKKFIQEKEEELHQVAPDVENPNLTQSTVINSRQHSVQSHLTQLNSSVESGPSFSGSDTSGAGQKFVPMIKIFTDPRTSQQLWPNPSSSPPPLTRQPRILTPKFSFEHEISENLSFVTTILSTDGENIDSTYCPSPPASQSDGNNE